MNTEQLLKLHAQQTQLMIEVVNNQSLADQQIIKKQEEIINTYKESDKTLNAIVAKKDKLIADLELSLKGCEGELQTKNDKIAMLNLRVETLEQASEKKVAELQEIILRQSNIIEGLE